MSRKPHAPTFAQIAREEYAAREAVMLLNTIPTSMRIRLGIGLMDYRMRLLDAVRAQKHPPRVTAQLPDDAFYMPDNDQDHIASLQALFMYARENFSAAKLGVPVNFQQLLDDVRSNIRPIDPAVFTGGRNSSATVNRQTPASVPGRPLQGALYPALFQGTGGTMKQRKRKTIIPRPPRP